MSSRPVSIKPVPDDYADWLRDLKARIHSTQQCAALAVSHELVLLYGQFGCDILALLAEQGWGAKVIELLAHDLPMAFPEIEGFSERSVKRMLAFYREYASLAFVQEPLAQMGAKEEVQQTVGRLH